MQEQRAVRISSRVVYAQQPPIKTVPDERHVRSAPMPEEATKKLQEPLVVPPAIHRVDECAKAIVRIVSNSSYTPPRPQEKFSLVSASQLLALCRTFNEVHRGKGAVCHIEAPAKVFGDIHGQWSDLLDIFACFGWPTHYRGDLEALTYVFNGDFVDRGCHSLEVVAFLFACKILYPNNIVLVRGNHEVREVNARYGFKDECQRRLGRGEGTRVWEAINDSFDFLPLMCVVSRKILILHGGIGEGDWTIDEMSQRVSVPLDEAQISQNSVLSNILWSDPADSDAVVGVHASSRGEDLVCFSSAMVREFCERNGVDLVVRSHQCVTAGFELFAGGKLCTIFSAVSYAGVETNDASCMSISPALECCVKVMLRRPDFPSIQSVEDPSKGEKDRFFGLLGDIGMCQLSRQQVVERLTPFSSSDDRIISTVFKAMQSLLNVYSSGKQSSSVVIIPQDRSNSVTRERLEVAQVYLHRNKCKAMVLGPDAELMRKWLIEHGIFKDVIVALKPMNFSDGVSTVVDAALTAKRYLGAVRAYELIVVASDFNSVRVQRVYDQVFRTSVKIVVAETLDRKLMAERLRHEEENLSSCMEVLLRKFNLAVVCLDHQNQAETRFGWGKCTVCKRLVDGVKADGQDTCVCPLLCDDCARNLGECIWCRKQITFSSQMGGEDEEDWDGEGSAEQSQVESREGSPEEAGARKRPKKDWDARLAETQPALAQAESCVPGRDDTKRDSEPKFPLFETPQAQTAILSISAALSKSQKKGGSSKVDDSTMDNLRKQYLLLIETEGWVDNFRVGLAQQLLKDILALGEEVLSVGNESLALEVVFKEHVYTCPSNGSLLIGRKVGVDVVLEDKKVTGVSRLHAVILFYPALKRYIVVDVGSWVGIETLSRSSSKPLIHSVMSDRNVLTFDCDEIAQLRMGVNIVTIRPKPSYNCH